VLTLTSWPKLSSVNWQLSVVPDKVDEELELAHLSALCGSLWSGHRGYLQATTQPPVCLQLALRPRRFGPSPSQHAPPPSQWWHRWTAGGRSQKWALLRARPLLRNQPPSLPPQPPLPSPRTGLRTRYHRRLLGLFLQTDLNIAART
jgi:hypothetical protein